MSLNLYSQKAISLNSAARTLLPQPNGRPISPATAHRWVHRGVLAADGSRVRLSAIRLGRVFVTTEDSVRGFLAELSRRSGVASQAAKTNSQIAADLKKKGLL